MTLGNSLSGARKKSGLSQEEVAEKLGVSRQTVSKWEQDETVPDIYQSKKLASAYGMTLDELTDFDFELSNIQEIIEKTDEEKSSKIDWTKAWSKKYPVLAEYQSEVKTDYYADELSRLLTRLKNEYGYNDLNAMLVLKDILAQLWKNRKSKK